MLRNRRAADPEIADKVSHYLDEATDVLADKGFSAEEARLAAWWELGSATAFRREVQGYGWGNGIDTVLTICAMRRAGYAPILGS